MSAATPSPLLRDRTNAAITDRIIAGHVYLMDQFREAGQVKTRAVLIDLTLAHSEVLSLLHSAHNSENTAKQSELVGCARTLTAMARAVRNRSYVLAAAMTSESGRLSASIASTLTSNSFRTVGSFIALDSLEIVELEFCTGEAA